MNLTKEQIQKAKRATSAKEIVEMAKKENINVSEEDAKKLFDSFHANTKIDDNDLNRVAGGCGDSTPDYTFPDGAYVRDCYRHVRFQIVQHVSYSKDEASWWCTIKHVDNGEYSQIYEKYLRAD